MSFRVVLVAMDGMGGATLGRACRRVPAGFSVELAVHAAEAVESEAGRSRLARDLSAADLVLLAHLLDDRQAEAIGRTLAAAAPERATILAFHSSGAAMRLTRVGAFRMTGAGRERRKGGGRLRSMFGWLARGVNLREHLRSLMVHAPKILRFLPGRAKDLRTFIESYLAWIEGSEENLRDLVLRVAHRHHGRAGAAGADAAVRRDPAPGAWHPATGIVAGPRALLDRLDAVDPARAGAPRVGLLVLRGPLLGADADHLARIAGALEGRSLRVLPVFGSIFDYRPVLEELRAVRADLLVSATGFPLVGGHVECRPEESVAALAALDVPYLQALSLAHQDLARWRTNHQGLAPVQLALNVALPELEGAIEPLVVAGSQGTREVDEANLSLLAARAARWTALRRRPAREKRIAVTVFRFPPQAGALGTAAALDVFASLHRLLAALAAEGYEVDVPADAATLLATFRDLETAVEERGDSPIAVDVSELRRWTPGLEEIETHWGEAPGTAYTNGRRVLLLARRFGNVLVGVQPPMGYHGDPMKLLFVRDAAPTHAFAAFYGYVREGFGADAVVHLGTHGALEFMPGKETGLSSDCWPIRLGGDLPNVYVYSVNNPAEGTIAKRRSLATLVGHLTPPGGRAGLYRGLASLKDVARAFRAEADPARRDALYEAAGSLAAECHLAEARAGEAPESAVDRWLAELLDLERSLIPLGLHVLGTHPDAAGRVETVLAALSFDRRELGVRSVLDLVAGPDDPPAIVLFDRARAGDAASAEALRIREDAAREVVRELLGGAEPAGVAEDLPGRPVESVRALAELGRRLEGALGEGRELQGVLAALGGRYVVPGLGADPIRNPSALPTGRNLHGLSPDHVPSAPATAVARVTAERFLRRVVAERGSWPDTVAVVLWAMDNIKTGGESLALVLELLGVSLLADGLGRLRVVQVRPLDELGHPRIDVVVTVSGIFRDVFPGASALLDEAVRLVADLDEPPESNRVRKRVLGLVEAGVDPAEARTRIFGNGPGAYGGNVNRAVESGAWEDAADLARMFRRRKSFAFVPGEGLVRKEELFDRLAGEADCVLQSIDSVDIGLSDVDHYFDYLGGLSLVARARRGVDPDVYLADTTTALGRVDRLEEVSAREARVKLLNPRWHEAMLAHGYEGVRELATRLENLYGLSATTGKVGGWVFDETVRTFVGDAAMAARLERANPDAFRSMLRTLTEARDRGLWTPDEGLGEVLDAREERASDLAEFPGEV